MLPALPLVFGCAGDDEHAEKPGRLEGVMDALRAQNLLQELCCCAPVKVSH